MTTWVIKVVATEVSEEPSEYLHDWETKCYEPVSKPSWTMDQAFAHRFVDRNYASRIANSATVQMYSENVRVVRLKPKTPDEGGGA